MNNEVIINATIDQIKDFKESLLWADMQNELSTWKTGFEQELLSISDSAADENPSTAAVLIHLGDVSGRTKTVNYLLSLPDIFLQILEEKKDDIKCK